MQEISSGPAAEMRALIELSSQIARRGYGEPVIELALRRKGVSREVARLVAASAASCHAAILATTEHAQIASAPVLSARITDDADLRAARAARLALSRIVGFIVFVIAGVGGGAFLGWSIGFNQGVEDSYDWMVRMIERLAGG